MEQSNSGMMEHSMPYDSNKPSSNQKIKMKKKPNGTSFKHSEVDSIFALVKMQDGNVHIAIGNNIVSRKTFKTFKKADEYIASKPYEILINVACLILNTQKHETTTETKETKENPSNVQK